MAGHPYIADAELGRRRELTLERMGAQDLQVLIAFSSYQEREGHVGYLANHHNLFPNVMSHSGMGHAAYALFADGTGVLAAPWGCQMESLCNVDQAVTDNGLVPALVAALKQKGCTEGKAGIAGLDVIPAEYYLELERAFPALALENADDLLESQRAVKSPAEMEALKEAARIGSVGLRAGMDAARAGAFQFDVEAAARRAALQAGADFVPRVRVSSGKRVDTLDWPMTRRRVLEDGDFIFLDLIGWHCGYGWDNSRVGFIGTPDADQRRFLDLMVDATAWMIEVLEPGRTIEFVPTEARGFQVTPMAHGIGLEICENPWLKLNRPLTLQPGMVVCIEPIVSSPVYGGMAIEDTVLVGERGSQVISPAERIFW